jgi:hypothetical protein
MISSLHGSVPVKINFSRCFRTAASSCGDHLDLFDSETNRWGYLIHGKDSVKRKGGVSLSFILYPLVFNVVFDHGGHIATEGGVWDCGYSLKTVQRGRQSSIATYLTLKFLYRPVPLLCTNPVNIYENLKKSTLDSFQNKF